MSERGGRSVNRREPFLAGIEIPDSATPSSRGPVARAALIIALGNVLSRVLGLARNAVIYHFFGATGTVSALNLAQQIPQWIYDFLVGGHISAALVPVFSEHTAEERRAELWRIASAFLSLAALVLAAVVLVMEVAAPWIIALTGGGLPPDLQAQATTLLRVIAPAMLFLGLTGAVTGLLYSLRRFTYPAFATAVFNAGIIAVVFATQQHLGITGAALGVLGGALLQLLLQLPGLRGTRLRPTLRFRQAGLRRIMQLYLPVLFGVAVGIVGGIVDRRLASGTGESSIAWMDGATRLIQAALGLIAVAVSVAVLPALSRADSEGDEACYQATLGLGLRLILTLVIPATALLLALGRPLVALLYQHGAFGDHDTTMVTAALYLYIIGLPFAAVDQLAIFAFYARKNTLLPNLVQVYAIGIYLLFALPFVGPWGMFALVLANSAQWAWHTLMMLLLLRRQIGWPRGQRVGATLVRALAASAAMGLAAWATAHFVGQALGARGTVGWLVAVGAAVAVAVAVYAGLAVALRLEEVRVAWEALRRKVAAPRGDSATGSR